MPDQILNVLTQAAYVDALTLGPTNYDGISVNVWNNSCISQVYNMDSDGAYQGGSWGAESLEAANSTFVLQNCGGVRFRTNPATAASPASIIAYAWKSGDVQKLGGIQLAGTISPSGAVTPTSGAMQLVQTETVTVATPSIAFGVPAGSSNLELRGSLRGTSAAAVVNTLLTINFDVGLNYDTEVDDLQNITYTGTPILNGGAPVVGIMPGATAPAAAFGSFRLALYDYPSTVANKAFESWASAMGGAAANMIRRQVGGLWHPAAAAAVTTVTLNPAAGNFDVGSQLSLYTL